MDLGKVHCYRLLTPLTVRRGDQKSRNARVFLGCAAARTCTGSSFLPPAPGCIPALIPAFLGSHLLRLEELLSVLNAPSGTAEPLKLLIPPAWAEVLEAQSFLRAWPSLRLLTLFPRWGLRRPPQRRPSGPRPPRRCPVGRSLPSNQSGGPTGPLHAHLDLGGLPTCLHRCLPFRLVVLFYVCFSCQHLTTCCVSGCFWGLSLHLGSRSGPGLENH